jgi:hypothetical protein
VGNARDELLGEPEQIHPRGRYRRSRLLERSSLTLRRVPTLDVERATVLGGVPPVKGKGSGGLVRS